MKKSILRSIFICLISISLIASYSLTFAATSSHSTSYLLSSSLRLIKPLVTLLNADASLFNSDFTLDILPYIIPNMPSFGSDSEDLSDSPNTKIMPFYLPEPYSSDSSSCDKYKTYESEHDNKKDISYNSFLLC